MQAAELEMQLEGQPSFQGVEGIKAAVVQDISYFMEMGSRGDERCCIQQMISTADVDAAVAAADSCQRPTGPLQVTQNPNPGSRPAFVLLCCSTG
jgi:hypothetical protein